MRKLFKNIFIKENKEKELSTSQIEHKLNKISLSFFPGSGAWYSTCFNRPNELNKDNLPCHLRDYNWLARMIQKENNLYNIDIKTIEEYLKNSQMFNEQRDKYERRIIFWQINWMKKGGEGWIVNHMYGGDFFSMDDKCESIFRQGVIDTLTAIGMDKEVIEESLEYYSNIWKNQMMKLSFENKYEYTHTFPTYRQNCIDLNPRSLEPSNRKFKESWLKLRRYDYYQEHKKYVDMVKEMEDVSSMTEEEASILREFVRKESDKRLAEVKAFKDYMFEIDKTLVCGIESPLGELYIDKKEGPSLKLK